MMLALSLWRPWPWAILHAGKRVENRSWAPPKSVLGEWVAMHAAQKFDEEAAYRMFRGDFGELARRIPVEDGAVRVKHPAGIVGAMRVSGWYTLRTGAGLIGVDGASPCVWRPLANDMRSPWVFGPYCWAISHVVELAQPIPCKGKQGLWPVPAEIESALRTRIAEAA